MVMHRRPILALFVIGSVLGLPGGSLLGQEPDADHDGVPDALDRCPNTAQLRKLPPDFRFGAAVNPARLKPGPSAHPVDSNGCELDNDGDGVVNSQDFCPDDATAALSAGVAANGCPQHSDFDGTPDYRDRCPDTPRGVATDAHGCPVMAGAPNQDP
jgi:OOP family OmpA-OmpF porin